MGEWELNTREVSLVEFQQWIWAKIPPEDEEWFSQNPKSIRQRRRRNKLKTKKDYENLLKTLKEEAKKNN